MPVKYHLSPPISLASPLPPSPFSLSKNHFPNDFAQANRKKKKKKRNHISLLPPIFEIIVFRESISCKHTEKPQRREEKGRELSSIRSFKKRQEASRKKIFSKSKYPRLIVERRENIQCIVLNDKKSHVKRSNCSSSPSLTNHSFNSSPQIDSRSYHFLFAVGKERKKQETILRSHFRISIVSKSIRFRKFRQRRGFI